MVRLVMPLVTVYAATRSTAWRDAAVRRSVPVNTTASVSAVSTALALALMCSSANVHVRHVAVEAAYSRSQASPTGTSVSAPHVEVGVRSGAVGRTRRASRSVVPSRGSGQRARTNHVKP